MFSFSGIIIINNNTRNATIKLNKSMTNKSFIPPNANRELAKTGDSTTIRLLEKEFNPLTCTNLFLGTINPVATADAGDWKAFIKPITKLTM